MTDSSALPRVTAAGSPSPRAWAKGAPTRWLRAGLRWAMIRPAQVVVILSVVFGTACIMLNPPMRGPDEQAHFARVFAYSHGVVLPSTEVNGRRGVFVPADLHDDFAFFNAHRHDIWTPGFSFRSVLDEHRARAAAVASTGPPPRDPVFVPFEGSEGYTAIAYAPHILAATIANWLGLDFVTMVAVMRLAGFATFTVVSALAVATTPRLKWAFVLIAMLPASLYGRAVIGADGAVNASSLMVTALALRAIAGADGTEMRGAGVLQRTTWMTLCVLSKPPMVAFILLEPTIHRWRALPRAARIVALVALPGLAVSLVWIWAVDAEMAAWRLTESGTYPAEHFRLGWKLEFMLENPLHFPAAMATTLWNDVFGLWRQTIGVLGWLDTHLNLWVYVAISLLLVVTALDAPALPPATRLRVALWGTLLIVAYGTAVFAILFITWTPPTEPQVWGVQGRYFVPVLPVAALVLATLGHRLPRRVLTIAAITGALIAGLATIEGLWRVNWVP